MYRVGEWPGAPSSGPRSLLPFLVESGRNSNCSLSSSVQFTMPCRRQLPIRARSVRSDSEASDGRPRHDVVAQVLVFRSYRIRAALRLKGFRDILVECILIEITNVLVDDPIAVDGSDRAGRREVRQAFRAGITDGMVPLEEREQPAEDRVVARVEQKCATKHRRGRVHGFHVATAKRGGDGEEVSDSEGVRGRGRGPRTRSVRVPSRARVVVCWTRVEGLSNDPASEAMGQHIYGSGNAKPGEPSPKEMRGRRHPSLCREVMVGRAASGPRKANDAVVRVGEVCPKPVSNAPERVTGNLKRRVKTMHQNEHTLVADVLECGVGGKWREERKPLFGGLSIC